MKLAGLPKFVLVSTLAGALLVVLSGCGSVAKTDNLSLTAGNWTLTATSSGINGTFYIGGNINQSGTSLSGTLYISNTLCYDPTAAVAFTGSVSGNNVTLTSASVNSQVITITATGTSGSALSGTYTLAGGSCASGDTGTIAAVVVPSLTGTWNGSVTGSGGSNVTLSLALTQAAQASSDGTFALTGTATYTGSTCSLTGTISSGSVAGPYLLVNANTTEADQSTGSFSYSQVLLDSMTAPKNMTGTYEVVTGLCAGDIQQLTLTKQ
jgi:hypothetical protein